MQTLSSQRLTLRQFAESDAEDVFTWISDARVTKFLGYDPHDSIDQTKHTLAAWSSDFTKENCYNWAIVYGGRVIGRIHSNYVSTWHRRCELGYVIGFDHWNMGLMSEALRCVLDYLFYQVNFNRVEAVYEPDNPASGRVMQKCGMKYEGTLRQFFLCRDGTYADAQLYAVLKEEFGG